MYTANLLYVSIFFLLQVANHLSKGVNLTGKELCFESLGCFPDEMPWRSPVRPIPKIWHPNKVGTKVYFYSREDTMKYWNITVYPNISLNGAPYKQRKPTYIIIHGFVSSGKKDWVSQIKDAILNQTDVNVLVVDWGPGANSLYYLQAVSNTQIVGREIGNLLTFLIHLPPESPSKRYHSPLLAKRKRGVIEKARRMHFIGHSLGAQISAYSAKYIRDTLRVKVGSITALDPAQPMFENHNEEVRLTKHDARVVVGVHTSARPFIPTLGMGHIGPVGHIDFYMNGGSHQPGCHLPKAEELVQVSKLADLATYDLTQISRRVLCDHVRAHTYFIEAISNPDCLFWGHRITKEKLHEAISNVKANGALSPIYAVNWKCSNENCAAMTLFTYKSKQRGSFIIETTGIAPFCVPEGGIFEILRRQQKRLHSLYNFYINKTAPVQNDVSKSQIEIENLLNLVKSKESKLEIDVLNMNKTQEIYYEMVKDFTIEHSKQAEELMKLVKPKFGIDDLEKLKQYKKLREDITKTNR